MRNSDFAKLLEIFFTHNLTQAYIELKTFTGRVPTGWKIFLPKKRLHSSIVQNVFEQNIHNENIFINLNLKIT